MRKDGIAVQVMQDMAQPVNTTEVWTFLNLCNYCQQFIPAVAGQLYQLLQVEPFCGMVWSDAQVVKVQTEQHHRVGVFIIYWVEYFY